MDFDKTDDIELYYSFVNPLLEMFDAWPDGPKEDLIEKHVCYARNTLYKSVRYFKEGQEILNSKNNKCGLEEAYITAGEGLLTASVTLLFLVMDEINCD